MLRESMQALARAIRGFVTGCESFHHRLEERTEARLIALAEELTDGAPTESQLRACRFIAYLPYTQPCQDEEPIAFALLCGALAQVNGSLCFEHYKERSHANGKQALAEMIDELRKR